MGFEHEIEWELPPHRDDEPQTLRQDIIDELADHLVSSYTRELLRGCGSGQARQRVLDRFGDPAAVARRLWFDAMKGAIMKQRVVLVGALAAGMLGILLVAGAFALVVERQRLLVELERARAEAAWREAEQARAALAQADSLTKALQENQAANRKMLEQINALAAAKSRSPDWNPVRIRLVADRLDGAPIADQSIQLALVNQAASRRAEPFEAATDRNGWADFGLMHPGKYYVSIRLPTKISDFYASLPMTVRAGEPFELTIACPRERPNRIPVEVGVDWPSDLADKGLLVMAGFTITDLVLSSSQGDVTWSFGNANGNSTLRPPPAGWESFGNANGNSNLRPPPAGWEATSRQPKNLVFLIGPRGQVRYQAFYLFPELWALKAELKAGNGIDTIVDMPRFDQYSIEWISPPNGVLSLAEAAYTRERYYVVKLEEETPRSARYRVLAASGTGVLEPGSDRDRVSVMSSEPGPGHGLSESNGASAILYFAESPDLTGRIPHGKPPYRLQPVYHARSEGDKPARFRIEIPELVAEQVRKNLKSMNK